MRILENIVYFGGNDPPAKATDHYVNVHFSARTLSAATVASSPSLEMNSRIPGFDEAVNYRESRDTPALNHVGRVASQNRRTSSSIPLRKD